LRFHFFFVLIFRVRPVSVIDDWDRLDTYERKKTGRPYNGWTAFVWGRLTQAALQRALLIEISPTSTWHVRPTEAGRAWLAAYLLTR
jgi:hypothetical protein